MADRSKTNRSLEERLADVDLIVTAVRKAVREALWKHKVAGNPVAVWRNGRVVMLTPEQIPVDKSDVEP